MLTQVDDSGNWIVKGIKWSDLHVGCVISRETADVITAALSKLRDYEDSGFDPDEFDSLAQQQLELANKMRSLIASLEWHPALGILPPENEEVLIVTRSKNGSRNIDKGYVLEGRWVHRGVAEVTHWMPMPALPKDE